MSKKNLYPVMRKVTKINHNTTVTENWTFQLHLKSHDTGMLCYRFRRPDILE